MLKSASSRLQRRSAGPQCRSAVAPRPLGRALQQAAHSLAGRTYGASSCPSWPAPWLRREVVLRSAPAQTQAQTAEEGLQLLETSTFYPYLESAGDTLVVVDFYTDWCGPCKVIYPELVKLSKERTDIKIVKFNCNKANKDLGIKLGIKVAPTFHLYRRSQKVGEMTGAKIDQLLALIDKAQSEAA